MTTRGVSRRARFYPQTFLSSLLYKPNTKSLRQSTNHFCFSRNQFYFVQTDSDKVATFFSLYFYLLLISRFRINLLFVKKKMEVSVMGNPQAKICRAELAYRELGFRLGSQVISGESRNRVSFLTHHQSSKWKEIGLRCSSLRSIKCEAIVSDQAPFPKPTSNSRSVIMLFIEISIKLQTLSRFNSKDCVFFNKRNIIYNVKTCFFVFVVVCLA